MSSKIQLPLLSKIIVILYGVANPIEVLCFLHGYATYLCFNSLFKPEILSHTKV